MTPFEEELPEKELDEMLAAWKSPVAPEQRLRAAVFPAAAGPWWRRLWSASLPVPMPLACVLALLMLAGAWRLVTPPPTRVVIQQQRVEVPVVQVETVTVYRDRIVQVPAANPSELQPVAELRPRIIRRAHAEN